MQCERSEWSRQQNKRGLSLGGACTEKWKQQRNRETATFLIGKKERLLFHYTIRASENCSHYQIDLDLVLSKLMLLKVISSKNFNLIKTLLPYSTTKRNARYKIGC